MLGELALECHLIQTVRSPNAQWMNVVVVNIGGVNGALSMVGTRPW